MAVPMRRTSLGLLLIAALVAPGCGVATTDVTAESLRAAKKKWQAAHLRDYDLEWTASGLRNDHYVVAVRGGRVSRVTAILPGGRTIERKPADPSYYGVDGLFAVIEDELDQLGTDAPFGRPKGSRIVLKFDPDETLGYPRRYRRDVVGAKAGLAIDVLRLDREPKSAGDESAAE